MNGRPLEVLPIALALLPATAFAGGSEGGKVIGHIAVAMVAASLFGVLMKVLRQPLLLGYILGGVLVGPIGVGLIRERHEVETLSGIGLILLLFMIGLEIDLKKMLQAGRWVIVTGLLQFPVSLALGYGLLQGIGALGLNLANGPYAVVYLAVGISISSTMIVVKLLYDKLELDTLAGRITVGILVLQDIWAIIVLAIQPNLVDPQVTGLMQTFGAGALLVAAALGFSKYVLPRIFHLVSKVPELMLIVSLGWCFLVGLIARHPRVGLSMEMGALVAGVALATFPYNLDVIAKVLNIRDFFITLFFVSLGMQIPSPEADVIGIAALCALVLILTRLAGVFGVLHVLRAGHFSSILPTINLSQMSEFSLVIIALGMAHGHIAQRTLTIGVWTFSLMAVASTYLIAASHPLERWLSRLFSLLGLKDLPASAVEAPRPAEKSVVILGYYRIADAYVNQVARRDQHVLEQLRVVDFNPEARKRLAKLGIDCVYGDISNPDTLHHAKIEEAQVLLSTVPDSALRGTSNEKLLKMLRALAPNAKIIVTADTPEHAITLYKHGADYVLQPSALAGGALVNAVEQALRGTFEGMREEAQVDLAAS
jgi:Kef-type K+ transport system membrane component KefB